MFLLINVNLVLKEDVVCGLLCTGLIWFQMATASPKMPRYSSSAPITIPKISNKGVYGIWFQLHFNSIFSFTFRPLFSCLNITPTRRETNSNSKISSLITSASTNQLKFKFFPSLPIFKFVQIYFF